MAVIYNTLWSDGGDMKITKNDVDHIASLARIKFDIIETARFADDLQDIITYFDKLSELETDNVGTDFGMTGISNVFRLDETKAGLSREDLLMNVPTHDDEFVIVPNTVD
jgi:aspartyl-tRNA(Asn)/glutamyl-tRNA(Gln) amidotransferase subunit C